MMQTISSPRGSHSSILLAISLLLLLGLISCSQDGQEAPRAEITHQWSGHYAEIKIPAAMAKDREDWQQVWSLLREPKPQWPEETGAFAVFYAGQRPTGGYRMEVEITYQDQEVIRLQCSLYPPDGPATTALTFPWKVVALSGVEGREVQVGDCGSLLADPP